MHECVQASLARDNATKSWQQQDVRENMSATHLESAKIYLQDVQIAQRERAWRDQRWKLD